MRGFIREGVDALRRVPVALGVAVALVMNAADGWWLDAGDRVRDMVVVLGVVAVVVGARWRSRPWWRVPWDLWLGFTIGTVAVLVVLGPGNIFPIVLMVGAVLSGGTVLVGWSVGALLREAFRRSRA